MPTFDLMSQDIRSATVRPSTNFDTRRAVPAGSDDLYKRNGQRQVYEALRSRLVSSGLGFRLLFWITGTLAFLISPIADNIPVMFTVLSMQPEMSLGQWLLVTLTAGVGGSLLSIGSAADAALMGQARGGYIFFSHSTWTWAIALGYAAGIATHFWINAGVC